MKIAKKIARNRRVQQLRSASLAFLTNAHQLNACAKAWAGGENADIIMIDLHYRGRPLQAVWMHHHSNRSRPSVTRVKFDAACPHNFFYNRTQWRDWVESLGPRLTK